MKLLPIRERQSSFSKFVPQLRARFLVVVVVESLSCVQLFDPIDGSTPSLLPCLSESPRVCSNSYPLSRWCYPTISFSLFTDCWWTANNLTRERNLCQGQVSKFLVIFKEAHSVRIWNLIEYRAHLLSHINVPGAERKGNSFPHLSLISGMSDSDAIDRLPT